MTAMAKSLPEEGVQSTQSLKAVDLPDAIHIRDFAYPPDHPQPMSLQTSSGDLISDIEQLDAAFQAFEIWSPPTEISTPAVTTMNSAETSIISPPHFRPCWTYSTNYPKEWTLGHEQPDSLPLLRRGALAPPAPETLTRTPVYPQKRSLGEAALKSRPHYRAHSFQMPRPLSRTDPRLISSEGKQGIQRLMQSHGNIFIGDSDSGSDETDLRRHSHNRRQSIADLRYILPQPNCSTASGVKRCSQNERRVRVRRASSILSDYGD